MQRLKRDWCLNTKWASQEGECEEDKRGKKTETWNSSKIMQCFCSLSIRYALVILVSKKLEKRSKACIVYTQSWCSGLFLTAAHSWTNEPAHVRRILEGLSLGQQKICFWIVLYIYVLDNNVTYLLFRWCFLNNFSQIVVSSDRGSTLWCAIIRISGNFLRFW